MREGVGTVLLLDVTVPTDTKMELKELLDVINVLIVAPLWWAISSIKNDIRELRQNDTKILFKLLDENHDK